MNFLIISLLLMGTARADGGLVDLLSAFQDVTHDNLQDAYLLLFDAGKSLDEHHDDELLKETLLLYGRIFQVEKFLYSVEYVEPYYLKNKKRFHDAMARHLSDADQAWFNRSFEILERGRTMGQD